MGGNRAFAAAVTAALTLAACSGGTGEKPPVPTESATPLASGEPTGASPVASGSVPANAVIPEGMRGRWGLVPADCTSTRGDAKGLLVVGEDTLRFYESTGRLAKVYRLGNSAIRAGFDFSGEGMRWTRDQTLELASGGTVLNRQEFGRDAAPRPFRYIRCQ